MDEEQINPGHEPEILTHDADTDDGDDEGGGDQVVKPERARRHEDHVDRDRR
jgi:hypothetical protein